MEHKLIKITDVEVIDDYKINVSFEDGLEKVIDLTPVLKGELYGPLKNKNLFNQVSVNKEVHTIEWPNGADFEPSLLYQWESVKDEFIKMASRWEVIEEK